jgi:hypothetical protein
MKRDSYAATLHRMGWFGALALGTSAFSALSSCSDPLPGAPQAGSSSGSSAVSLNEDCPAGDDWLPNTPPVRMFDPAPHPDTECPFYRGAYQNFLIATQPLANGDPALLQYPTLDDAFTSAKPHGVRNTAARSWLGAVRQAGQRDLLIDRDHHTLYYGLHMNQAFVDFIKTNNLQTVDGILNVDPSLSFPPGLAEFKSAWKDIDPQDFPNGVVPPPTDFEVGEPGDWSNYITTMAWLPHLTQDPVSKVILEDHNHPVLRKVALIAIHSVYTLPGHPEFIWGSIQHVNLQKIDPAAVAFAGVNILGMPDSQPDTTGPTGAPELPKDTDPQNLNVTQAPDPMHNYALYAKGTPENGANQAIPHNMINFDEPSQSFPNQVTNVYRMFPGSKSNDLAPDGAVFSLNSNLNALFAQHASELSAADKRMNYRLVAAVWMDKPQLFGLGADGMGMSLQNDDTSPLVVGSKQNPPNLYPEISQGNFCGTPLDSQNISGDSPNAKGHNTVPNCTTREDDFKNHLLPSPLFASHDPDNGGTDSAFSLLGGEDRLSSTSMETFTQNGNFNNCFQCHNTQPVSTNGTPFTGAGTALIPHAAMINVSHLFSEFVLEEQEEAAAGN